MSKASEQREAILRAAVGAEQVFALHQWTWSTRDGKDVEPYVPSEKDIGETLARLLEDLRENKSWSIGTGRLLVQKDELHGYSFLLRLSDLSTDEDDA